MSDADRILSEFVRAWSAGELPDADEYVERAPPRARRELSEQIATFLMVAPEPAYGDEARARLEADPVARRLAAFPLGEPEPWPSLLPRLRERAGTTWADVARRLGVSRPEKAQRYLEAMERGTHDPASVTWRLLDRLGAVLGVPADALAWRGRPPAAPSVPALLRAAGEAPPPADRLEVLADLVMAEAVDWDDSDALFLGGRE